MWILDKYESDGQDSDGCDLTVTCLSYLLPNNTLPKVEFNSRRVETWYIVLSLIASALNVSRPRSLRLYLSKVLELTRGGGWKLTLHLYGCSISDAYLSSYRRGYTTAAANGLWSMMALEVWLRLWGNLTVIVITHTDILAPETRFFSLL